MSVHVSILGTVWCEIGAQGLEQYLSLLLC